MKAKKILFIGHAMKPYVQVPYISDLGHDVPKKLYDLGCETRNFLPKWGTINERRNQLHEVIRLSGSNIIINDSDHPLLIKVATLPQAHMQVYFIDSEDFFRKRLMETDENGQEYPDNYTRAIFYARSIMETMKKLRWYPDIIHCQGWFSSLVPYFIKTVYQGDPSVMNAKVVYSIYDEKLQLPIPEGWVNDLAFRTYQKKEIEAFGLRFETFADFIKIGVHFSDAVIEAQVNAVPEAVAYARESGKPFLPDVPAETRVELYQKFYDELLTDRVDEDEDD